MKAILPKLLGLPLLGLIATVGFVFLTFPDDKAQLLVQRHVEKLLDYEYRVEASEFDVGIFSGLEMKSVNLTPRFTVDDDEVMGPEGGSGEPAARDPESLEAKYFCPVRVVPVPMMFDRIAFDPSLTSLLSGNLEATFALEAAGGTLEGELGKGEEGQTLKAKIDAIALQRFTLLRNKMGMHLVGQLFGDIDLQFGEGMSLAGGSIAMNLRGVVMCPKKFKVNMKNVPFFEMPLTRLGNIEGTVEVTKQRRLEFKDFKGEGEDMSLSVQGSIQLTTDRIPRTRY
ncbi:MAG: type II secretion system protein GspN, partial [Deltaproteobacteria bacterium CG_4_9_14_3_um_filter_63_12]